MNMNPKQTILSTIILALLMIAGCSYNAPQQLTAVSAKDGIQLTWQPAPEAVEYNIYRGTSQSKLEKINNEPTQKLNYLDKNIISNLIYYYKITAVDTYGKETSSSIASASKLSDGIINEVFSINNNAEYTTSSEVLLKINGIGAQKCRFRNEENPWSPYEDYAPQKTWILSEGDGQKTVYVQCKDNLNNEAKVMQSTVTLLAVKPTVTMYEPDPNLIYFGAFNLTFLLTASFDARCSYILDGSITDLETIKPGQLNTYFIGADQGYHTISVKCVQGPYTVETNSTNVQILTDETIVRITINQGADYTNTRQVTLNLLAPKAQFCRYGNDEKNNYGSWEPYYNMRYWRLTSEEGLKTVFYQCKDKDGIIIGTASDSIKLKYE